MVSHWNFYGLVGGFNHLEKYESMGRIIRYGKDYPIYYGKKLFETTNQMGMEIATSVYN